MCFIIRRPYDCADAVAATAAAVGTVVGVVLAQSVATAPAATAEPAATPTAETKTSPLPLAGIIAALPAACLASIHLICWRLRSFAVMLP